MATTQFEEQIDEFDEGLRRLKTLYDLYFAGSLKMPPLVERRKLDVMLHEMSRETIRDNALRFRYTTLAAKYQQFRELWSRRMREREEGPMDFRKRKALFSDQAADSTDQAVPPHETAPVPPRGRVTSKAAETYVRVTSAGDGAAIKEIYERIAAANNLLGKPSQMTLDQVQAIIEKQAQQVRLRFGVAAVGFRVDTEDGKVKIKARPEGPSA